MGPARGAALGAQLPGRAEPNRRQGSETNNTKRQRAT